MSVYFHFPGWNKTELLILNSKFYVFKLENKGTISRMDRIEYFYTSVASINMEIFEGRNHKTDRNLQLTLNIQHFPYF